MARIQRADLDLSPLCLGGNTFGWATNDSESFAVLDAYVAGGGNLIDTTNVYSGQERPPYQVREGGSYIAFVRDPDGYRIELVGAA
jgi:aryl-alcohol dehydrogenase-like predicted oxidoreductase